MHAIKCQNKLLIPAHISNINILMSILKEIFQPSKHLISKIIIRVAEYPYILKNINK
jgi:hypothetical protein